jgi:hypothetical protein
MLHSGPERSGSTWLFNAIRLLMQDAKEPLDPFWITHLTDEALRQRGAGQCMTRASSVMRTGFPTKLSV